MRKYLIFLCALLLMLLCACSTASSQEESTFLYYYPAMDSSQGTLCSQPANVNPGQLSPEDFLNSYLGAARPQGAQSPLPAVWKLADFSLEGSVLHLTFSGSAISPIDRSVRLSCLVQTLLQHPQVESLSVLTPGNDIPTLLSAKDILFKDNGMKPQEAQVVVYYPDPQRRYLLSQTRTVEATYKEDFPAFIMKELLSRQGQNCIPPETKLLSVHVENGVCTVNLSWEFAQNMEPSFAAARMAVYSIVNSLTELPEITTVDLWVAGTPLNELYLMDLSRGLSRDESLLAPPAQEGLLDISLYPVPEQELLLVEIPLTLKLQEDESLTKQVVEQLLSYEGKNGLKNPIPQGTKLLSVRMENNICVLDFTGEFLAGCHSAQEETLAVRSVITTVCALENITAVEILVEGIEPAFRDEDLASLRRPLPDWVAQ